jgi:hypothetical protein
MDDAGNTVVAWQELRNGDWDIVARKVMHTGLVRAAVLVQGGSRMHTFCTVAMDRSDGDFVVAYQSQTSARGPAEVLVTEMSSTGRFKGTFSAGVKSEITKPAVSIDLSDRYFVAYVLGDELEIRGRRGKIV